jgi:hypothetical protein
MPLVAMNQKGERVELWRYNTETMLRMRDKLKAGGVAYCPECGGQMTIKAINSPHYIAHFAHLPSAQSDGCEYGRGESQEHLAAKAAIAEYISGFAFYTGAMVHIEYKMAIPDGYKPTRRADVVAIMPNGDIHAHEAQLSFITTDSLRERTSDYRKVSSEVVWWLGNKADTSDNEHEVKILSIFGRITRKENKTALHSELTFMSQLKKRGDMETYLKELTGNGWGYVPYHENLYKGVYPDYRSLRIRMAPSLAHVLDGTEGVETFWFRDGANVTTEYGGKATIKHHIKDSMYMTVSGSFMEDIDGVLYDLKWTGSGRDFTRQDGRVVTISTAGKVTP